MHQVIQSLTACPDVKNGNVSLAILKSVFLSNRLRSVKVQNAIFSCSLLSVHENKCSRSIALHIALMMIAEVFNHHSHLKNNNPSRLD